MTAPTSSVRLSVRPHAIPAELRERSQWVAWRWENRDGKQTKIPINVRCGARAKSDDPTTWADFDASWTYAQDHLDTIAGVGYVFSADDPFTGVDFDDCRDPGSGVLDPWAAAILGELNSYAEVSPSGMGVKTVARASLPGHGVRRKRPDGIPGGMVEMYDRGRFFTLTGWHIPSAPASIHDAPDAAGRLYLRLTHELERRETQNPPDNVNAANDVFGVRAVLLDDELIARARNCGNGAKFSALWMGDISGHPSHSEADLALCSMIAFYTGPDPARIDHLFRRSLLMRAKWDERHGAGIYGAMTIAEALKHRTEYWQPGDRNAHDQRQQGARTEETSATKEDASFWKPPTYPWPEPLADEAYHGLAGEIVRAVEPQTEGDPVGILGQFLVLFGNCIGRTPYFPIEADRHHTNLNLVTVGDTSGGRKGVALNRAKQPFLLADESWAAKRIAGGLSSAEGLIWQVRDPIRKWEKDRETKALTEVVVDPGATDKRFLAAETEFAGVLRQFQRDGNTLSNLIRDAWDRGDLQTLVKNSPAKATGAHISIVGHVTKDELLRYLDTTEAANGLGNRFVWLCVKRSKALPDGGEPVDLAPFIQHLEDAIQFARTTTMMRRDTEARDIWHAVYGPLTEGKPGLLGAMVARAAPIIVRLSMIYALLDRSAVIRKEHLLAALALWDYAEASAQYIFGDTLGDAVADAILDALRRSPAGLTRTLISEVLGRNQKAERIERALALLFRNGLARCEQIGGGPAEGRPVERWFATTPGEHSSSSSTSSPEGR